VEWAETGKCNVYRVGHKGKVDIKCLKPAPGGYYYPSHLPVLGAPQLFHATQDIPDYTPPTVLLTTDVGGPFCSSEVPFEHHGLVPGDNVRVGLDVDIFKVMQEGHGDWDDSLLNNLSDVGTVQSVLDNGDIRVKYSGSRIYTLNHNVVTKVTCFSTGDIVQVIEDIAAVHSFQENHGGWVDDMALSLGQVGRVVKVFPTGDVRVVVNSRTWTYNPRCLSHAPLKEIAEDECA
jgi:E3 ubiquitin-protein ligase mind-bomb